VTRDPCTELPENLTVPRTDAVYNCHAYLTKVPIGAITPFIEAFTEPGDVVLDFFAGSGMTGLAAMCAGRRAELSDISVLGKHIASGYLARVDAAALRAAADEVMSKARQGLGNLYLTRRASDGALVEMVRTVWSFMYRCPECSTSLTFFDHVSQGELRPSACSSCGHPFAKSSWDRAVDVPVKVVVHGDDGHLAGQAVSSLDEKRIRAAANDQRQADIPSLSIDEDREMFNRSGLGKAGLRKTRDFFSPRNAIALYELWRAIAEVTDASLRQKLRFCFTAILARASRRYQWSRKRPLNAQNQTYYIAPVYYEWNVFELFQRKVEAAIRADAKLYPNQDLFSAAGGVPPVAYTTASASKLSHIASGSIDYIFTDPPFGSNIFYSDMSLFHEAWLGTTTDPTNEAVIRTTGKHKSASAERYQHLLSAAFLEGFRVLRPGAYMSVVFGNSSGRVWGFMQRALRASGFEPAPVHVCVLDKGQRSVKGLSSGSEAVVTVDLLVTVRKPDRPARSVPLQPATSVSTSSLIDQAVASMRIEDTRNPSHVYAHILRRAIQLRLPLDGLHLSDVLIALREASYSIDPKTGLLDKSRITGRQDPRGPR
jgi:16S rRNA G966 N2-methylase RsmD